MRPLALEAADEAASNAHASSARIGPNAIIQLGIAVEARLGEAARRDVFRRAGLTHYLVAPPEAMVNEEEVIALHRALRASVTTEVFHALSWEAGLLTGDYILANRIPHLAQTVLRHLPKRLATKVLTATIGKHSWTFAGSGLFRTVSSTPLILEISKSPLCRGQHSTEAMCDYYAGTFTRLYRSLVDPGICIVETACGAVDGGPCRFEAVAARLRERTDAGHPGA